MYCATNGGFTGGENGRDMVIGWLRFDSSVTKLGLVSVLAPGTFQISITAPSNLVPGVHYRVLRRLTSS